MHAQLKQDPKRKIGNLFNELLKRVDRIYFGILFEFVNDLLISFVPSFHASFGCLRVSFRN